MLFWLLLVVSSLVRADIDFVDCGSENVIVDKIDITGCDHVPCQIYKGHSYHLYITPDILDPEVTRIIPHASVLMWGAHIPIPAECDGRCISFSLRQHRNVRRLNITLEFPVVLLDRPAELYLWAEYSNFGKTEKRFCVAFPIDIH